MKFIGQKLEWFSLILLLSSILILKTTHAHPNDDQPQFKGINSDSEEMKKMMNEQMKNVVNEYNKNYKEDIEGIKAS